MKISTRLRLAVFVPIVMAVVIVAALAFSYKDMMNTQSNGATIREIRTSITEINHIVFSYVLYHRDASKQQFSAEQMTLNGLIAGLHLINPDQQRQLDSIASDNVQINGLFQQLVSNYNHDISAGTADPIQAETPLVDALESKVYEADNNAALLRTMIDDGIRTTEIKMSGLILLAILLATTTLTILLVRMRRTITSSLSDLVRGTTSIGSGNLNYKIDLNRNDEIGNLSGAFNRMTAHLRETTASKAELEKEIAARKNV